MGIVILYSCAPSVDKVYVVIGEHASEVEKSTVQDFKDDLQKVIDGEIAIVSQIDEQVKGGTVFLLGTIETNNEIAELVQSNDITLSAQKPGPRGGVWAHVSLKNDQKAIVLAGSDVQGFQYAVYDYTHEVLGIDPFEYWTGKMPAKNPDMDLYAFQNRQIAPPEVPILCYFENDVDELANYRGKLLEYDWESYTEMINSLVRIRYNAIQFFDMLGRPEFFIRPEYKKLKPDYQIDEEYLDKMIDYAHLKGMEVQVDLSLGYQLHPLPVEESYCWSTYKDKWIKGWKYYFENTPIAKADIFSLRPRHQVWDWEYVSDCGEDKTEVFNEVYAELGKLIDYYKPEATKIAFCYHDGMEMFNKGFNPPKDWIAVWCDNGFGEFLHMPDSNKGYEFGTYMHAGFWKNHTVHNPYPMVVDTIMKKMFREYDASKYCQVNGQNFRPFLLNLEAYSDVCNRPESFDGEDFYRTWTERYFSPEAAKLAVESMKILHDVQTGRNGYVEHLWEIRKAISYNSNSLLQRPGKTPIPHRYDRVYKDIDNLKRELDNFQGAVDAAEKGAELNTKNEAFYYSYVLLPVKLYGELIVFERSLHQIALLKKEFEETRNMDLLVQARVLVQKAMDQLETVHKTTIEGDKNPKWANFYDPAIRRPNNGFPQMEEMTLIMNSIETW
ncbi:glycosyl hydrolase 115 family protein [Saccharicrinis sp. GN24d3]|uniref:glycosyl hydrolase 115 family protein n=1 Tax=Saccharicrinis sp. GN24d3 TaxID=3458416 RepID=UPI004037234B